MKKKTEKRGAAPGENRGRGKQGRKKSVRPLIKKTVMVYADQLPIKCSEIRQAVDDFKARTFSETFSHPPGKTELEDL